MGRNAGPGKPSIRGRFLRPSHVELSAAGVYPRRVVRSGEQEHETLKRGEFYTNSLREPISVRNRSASNAASNGFLNVSLMLERSKLVDCPSSGKSAIRIVSAYSVLRRRF